MAGSESRHGPSRNFWMSAHNPDKFYFGERRIRTPPGSRRWPLRPVSGVLGEAVPPPDHPPDSISILMAGKGSDRNFPRLQHLGVPDQPGMPRDRDGNTVPG